MRSLTYVIPGRRESAEPGIQAKITWPKLWIPGSRLTARPGMTVKRAAPA